MKKVYLLLIPLTVLSVSSCKNNEVSNEKVNLLYGKIHTEEETSYIEEITETKLENMKTNANCDTFLLYYKDQFCSGCQEFEPILNEVAKENNLLVYSLDKNTLDSSSAFIKNGYSTPTLMLYKDGNLVKDFNPTTYETYYASKKGLETFLEEQVILPTCYYIDENQYKEKVNNNDSFIIMFTNYSCSQCQEINSIFLKDYIRENDIEFYLLSKDSVLENIPNDEKNEYWNNFKINNGFTDTFADGSSNPFGLGTGWTPTFQYREGNTIIEAAHPFATYDATVGEIVRHYYEDDPYAIGTKYDDSIAYKKATGSYYSGKLKEFLDQYKEKVNE